jgi:penicillin amidase
VSDNLPTADASNNWLVAGRHTASGHPILSSDPHLRTQIPSVWYLAELQSPALAAAGGTLPGAPWVFIGHSRHASWAATVMMTDQQDLFLLQPSAHHPTRVRPSALAPSGADGGRQYVLDGAEQPLRLFEEVIRVHGRSDAEHWLARESLFGPVVSDTPQARSFAGIGCT